MKHTNHYKVAGHTFSVSSEYSFDNYAPFIVPQSTETLFSLDVVDGCPDIAFAHELSQEDEGQQIVCGHTQGNEPVFEFWDGGQKAGLLVSQPDYRTNVLYIERGFERFSTDNALMIVFALASAHSGTLLFHSSVIAYNGAGYMFLGKSGTGKSTHSRLWLQNNQGAELLNDDNPAVRIHPDGIRVYGTPWSGKTDCYRCLDFPLGGIVLLSQAPYNRITPLKGVMAYASLVPSISGKRWDKAIADSLHLSETQVIEQIPMWHLECLPDADAALLCKNTVTCNKKLII